MKNERILRQHLIWRLSDCLRKRPVLLGMTFGGIPFGIMLARLGDTLVSPNFLGATMLISPLLVMVSAVGAFFQGMTTSKRMFVDAWRTAVAASIPIPFLVSIGLEWRFGYQPFAARGFFPDVIFLLIVLAVWGSVLSLPGWLLGQGLVFVKSRYFQRRKSLPDQ